MQLNEEMKNNIKNHLGYTDEELKEFLDNPRNQDVLSNALKIAGKTIIFEVVASHGCNSEHKVGDKIILDGGGNLITKLNPKRICIYALSELDKLVFAATELIFAGVDPNEIRFPRVSCIDVGLKCDGWGQIVMEMKIEDRKK